MDLLIWFAIISLVINVTSDVMCAKCSKKVDEGIDREKNMRLEGILSSIWLLSFIGMIICAVVGVVYIL